MLCPNCGQELPGADTICPACGYGAEAPAPLPPEPEAHEDLNPETGPAQEAAETDVKSEADSVEPDTATEAESVAPVPEPVNTDTEPEPEPVTENAEAETPAVPQASVPKRDFSFLIAIGAVAVLALILWVCIRQARSGVFDSGAAMDSGAIAVQVTDETGAIVSELTNEDFSYYYWGEYYYFLQNYGMSFDPAVPLDQQIYDGEQTWQDYFVESTLTSIQQTQALKAQAAAAGFTMPAESQTQYDSTVSLLADNAKASGFTDDAGNGDILAYIRDSYGPDATEEGFYRYLYDSYFVTAYSTDLYNQELDFTDQELSDYFDENADMFSAYGIEKSEQANVAVRHILISPAELDADASEEELEKAKADAEEEAQRIYQEWQDGEATEETFAELATSYSTDPGSSANGGLYENVYPGQMVPAFNDWCFDEERQPGDSGIVETDYGYHIMYYVGSNGQFYWKEAAAEDLQYANYVDTLNGITAKYTAAETDRLSLVTPDAVTAIMEEYATQTAGSAAEASAP